MDKVYKQMKSKTNPIQSPLIVLCSQGEWKCRLFSKMWKKRENKRREKNS